MYSKNYSTESVQPTAIPVDNAFLLVVSLASLGRVFMVITSNALFFSKSQMSKVSDVFLSHGFLYFESQMLKNISFLIYLVAMLVRIIIAS